jgi:hypothetical protein
MQEIIIISEAKGSLWKWLVIKIMGPKLNKLNVKLKFKNVKFYL